MTDFDFLHEAEDVLLASSETRWCTELWQLLPQIGFELDEDLFAIDRQGRIPLWQSRTVVAAHILHGEREVFDEHSTWDRMRLRFLLATLPASALGTFVEKAALVSERLRLPMQFHGREVSKEELHASLMVCMEDLRRAIGEPGSKEVAAAIEATYPRR